MSNLLPVLNRLTASLEQEAIHRNRLSGAQ